MCPVCNCQLTQDDLIEIDTCSNITESKALPLVNEPMFDTTKHETVNITSQMCDTYVEDRLVTLDECDLNTVSYSINAPTMNDTLNGRFVNVRNSMTFKNQTEYKYTIFLKDIDMSNIVLAGGFCRSIMLRQRPKDLDFFFYGLEDPTRGPVSLLNSLCRIW